MTQVLLVAVLLAGGMLAAMVASRVLLRNLAGALVTVALAVALVVVVAGAGVTALHRVAGGVRLQITEDQQAPQHTATATPRATPVPGPPPAMLAAERRVAAMGYRVADPATFHPENSLHLLVGEAGDGATVPRHRWVFFFDGGGALLGEDADLPSASVVVLGQGATTAALGYQLWAAGDADCCPSLGTAAVRFRLDPGGALRRIDRLPLDEARRACCPAGGTDTAGPPPTDSRRQ